MEPDDENIEQQERQDDHREHLHTRRAQRLHKQQLFRADLAAQEVIRGYAKIMGKSNERNFALVKTWG